VLGSGAFFQRMRLAIHCMRLRVEPPQRRRMRVHGGACVSGLHVRYTYTLARRRPWASTVGVYSGSLRIYLHIKVKLEQVDLRTRGYTLTFASRRTVLQNRVCGISLGLLLFPVAYIQL